MLALAFFISVFSTLIWLIFSAAYVSDHLNGVSFISLGIMDITIFLGLILLPILVLWMVFGFINQYLANRSMNNNLFSLFKQMKKNQDYTDLIARVMLEAEQEIKDGFILSKFDLFVADMNELIADLLLRCNIATPEQIERLWTKVQNGGKWAFGKVLIEVNQNQSNFQMRVFEKSQHDNVIAGTILEWSARYLSLISLLEKHDKERVFITIIETGVFGKVFSILAPVSDEIRRSREFAPSGPSAPAFASQRQASTIFEDEPTQAQAPMPTPKPKPGYARRANVEESSFSEQIDTKSFAARLNPFRKKESSDEVSPVSAPVERDALSLALERSFGSDEEISAPRVSKAAFNEDNAADIRIKPEPENISEPLPGVEPNEPKFNLSFGADDNLGFEVPAPKVERDEPRLPPPSEEPVIERSSLTAEREDPARFSNTSRTLNTLKKEWEEMRTATQPSLSHNEKPEPKFGMEEDAISKKPSEAEEENFTYPFGGWTDEANYHK